MEVYFFYPTGKRCKVTGRERSEELRTITQANTIKAEPDLYLMVKGTGRY
jgi:hypothetical protein